MVFAFFLDCLIIPHLENSVRPRVTESLLFVEFWHQVNFVCITNASYLSISLMYSANIEHDTRVLLRRYTLMKVEYSPQGTFNLGHKITTLEKVPKNKASRETELEDPGKISRTRWLLS